MCYNRGTVLYCAGTYMVECVLQTDELGPDLGSSNRGYSIAEFQVVDKPPPPPLVRKPPQPPPKKQPPLPPRPATPAT
jgi:hypothetical protein